MDSEPPHFPDDQNMLIPENRIPPFFEMEIIEQKNIPPEADEWHLRMIRLATGIPGGVLLNIPKKGVNGIPCYYLIRSISNNHHQEI